MNLKELKASISHAERGSLSDLGKVLRSVADGDVQLQGGDFVTLKIGGTEVTASAAELNKLDGAGDVVASGTQEALISDPTGGATTDAEARTAINAIIDALQAFGIVASE